MTKFVRSCNKMFFISINKKFPCAELSLGHRQHRIILQIQLLKWSKTSTGTLPLPSLPFSTVSISIDIRTGSETRKSHGYCQFSGQVGISWLSGQLFWWLGFLGGWGCRIIGGLWFTDLEGDQVLWICLNTKITY